VTGGHALRHVAPCACGAAPLTPAHRYRARTDVLCAERVADVELLARMLAAGEDAGHVPEALPGGVPHRRTGFYLAAQPDTTPLPGAA
jgi:hypothetical protein